MGGACTKRESPQPEGVRQTCLVTFPSVLFLSIAATPDPSAPIRSRPVNLVPYNSSSSSMGNQGSQKRGSSDDGPGVPSEVIRQKLLQLDAMLKEPAPEIDDMLWTTGEGTSCARGEAYAEVVIGTSKIATPQLVSQI